MNSVKIVSNVDAVKQELENRIDAIMEGVGLQAEGNAITEITRMGAVDTGRLRNSITFATINRQGSANTQGGTPAKPDDYAQKGTAEHGSVYIGTNVEYAPYIELGARRMAPRPFLKNAIANYSQEYKRIMEDGLK